MHALLHCLKKLWPVSVKNVKAAHQQLLVVAH
jgi:hypothetical protein